MLLQSVGADRTGLDGIERKNTEDPSPPPLFFVSWTGYKWCDLQKKETSPPPFTSIQEGLSCPPPLFSLFLLSSVHWITPLSTKEEGEEEEGSG